MIIKQKKKRSFAVISGLELSCIFPILAGVPRGAILCPAHCNLYSSDQPMHHGTKVAEHADDKTVYSINSDPVLASMSLRNHLNTLTPWYSCGEMKIND